MDKREKLEAIDKILRELDDLKNSEVSVLKKITQIEAENMNLGIQLLEKTLPDVHETSDKTIEQIDEIVNQFTEYRNKFSKDNKLEEAAEEAS